MATAFNLSTAPAVLPCPQCGQTINTSMRTCPYCHTALDHTTAEVNALEFSRVNAAVSDASYLRIMGMTAITFCFLRFVPFLGLIGVFGFLFLEFAIPFMTIRWWVKYHSLKSNDLEFTKAKKTALWFGVGATILAFLVQIGTLVI